MYEGAPQVLHHRKPRGAPAGQDDRPRPQQVQGDVREGGRGAGADHGEAGLGPDVLMSVRGREQCAPDKVSCEGLWTLQDKVNILILFIL